MRKTGIILFLYWMNSAHGAGTILELNPEMVVTRTVEKSQQRDLIEASFEDARANWLQSRSVFDFYLCANSSLARTDFDPLSRVQSEEEQQILMGACAKTKLPSGTALNLTYGRDSKEVTLSPFMQSQNGLSATTEDLVTVELRQELWSNLLGLSDRRLRGSQKLNYAAARIQRMESTEQLALLALSSYWNAYTAKENLEARIEIRERYKKLVSAVRAKSRLSFTVPGELARVEAEYEGQEQAVKRLSSEYLNRLDELLQLIDEAPGQSVEFAKNPALPEELPIQNKNANESRVADAEKLKIEAARLKMESVEWRNRAKLDLIAKQSYRGADADPGSAFSDLKSGDNPGYFLGLEWQMSLDGDSYQAEISRARANAFRESAQARINQEAAFTERARAFRTLSANHLIAKSSLRTYALRERALKELERAYRQGRSDIKDVIDAYRDLINTQAETLVNTAQYHLALATWKAAEDTLVPSVVRD